MQKHLLYSRLFIAILMVFLCPLSSGKWPLFQTPGCCWYPSDERSFCLDDSLDFPSTVLKCQQGLNVNSAVYSPLYRGTPISHGPIAIVWIDRPDLRPNNPWDWIFLYFFVVVFSMASGYQVICQLFSVFLSVSLFVICLLNLFFACSYPISGKLSKYCWTQYCLSQSANAPPPTFVHLKSLTDCKAPSM